MQLITLTTDFGRRDWFVGTMKGVIFGIAPRATIVDLTHEIPAGNVRVGAFALAAIYRFYPKRTVHVAVIDPGVGSVRRAIAVQTENHFFVGPDNGVLSFALAREKIKTIRQLTNEKFFLKHVSQTFHGRDVFAPVTAHLSRGVPIQNFGPALKDFVHLDGPQPRPTRAGIEGEVVYIDHFGNAITNVPKEMLGSRRWEVCAGRKRLCPVREFYQAVLIGDAVALIGSCGLLEISINGSSAEKRFSLRVGSRISVRSTLKSR